MALHLLRPETKFALDLARPKQRLHSNPSLIQLFSTSSSSSQDGNESGEHPSQSPSDFKTSSYVSGLKSSLKQNPQPQDGRRQFGIFDGKAQNPTPSIFGNQIGGQIQDIRRNLNEFRSRAAAPPPRDLQDHYKQNVLSKSGDSHGTSKLEATPFASLKENLRQTSIQHPSIVKELRSEIRKAKAEEAKKAAFQKLDFWGVTPKYLLEPPKEELVETYFHSDNMSSAEKMEIELAKVREEFKMSESDCGSARVQVLATDRGIQADRPSNSGDVFDRFTIRCHLREQADETSRSEITEQPKEEKRKRAGRPRKQLSEKKPMDEKQNRAARLSGARRKRVTAPSSSSRNALKNHPDYLCSVTHAMDVLNGLSRVKKWSPLYRASMDHLMADVAHRQAFLTFSDPEDMIQYLRYKTKATERD